jgi:puromycin-sensitive aminopeptidase
MCLSEDNLTQFIVIYRNLFVCMQNAETPQLWAELEAASGQPVTAVMETWTRQMGFPLVSIRSRQEGTDRILTLSQTKFNASGERDRSGALWAIPISISWPATNQPLRIILDQPAMDLRLPGVLPGDWIKLNRDFIGFYRVAYGPQELQQLCTAVRTKALGRIDR